jgi:hypothetical protein
MLRVHVVDEHLVVDVAEDQCVLVVFVHPDDAIAQRRRADEAQVAGAEQVGAGGPDKPQRGPRKSREGVGYRLWSGKACATAAHSPNPRA